MPQVIVVDTQGIERVLQGPAEHTLMRVLRDNSVDDLQAVCGGCCSCATCHVWIDPQFLERMPEMTEPENDMLDGADQRKPNSRLSCQLVLDEAMDGIRLTVAPT